MQENVRAVSALSHLDMALTTTAAVLTVPARTSWLLLSNPDAAINVLVSVDNGTTFFTLAPGKTLELQGWQLEKSGTFKIKSASGTPTVNILCGTWA